MSQTFSLYCHMTKQKCWAGQSNGTRPSGLHIYNDPPNAAAIARFLEATAGHEIVLLEDEHAPSVCDEYEEFNRDDDAVDNPSHLT